MSLERLSPQSPAADDAKARRQDAKIGVVHFGPGAFHRAHQAWYFDQLLARDKGWGVCGVSLKSPGVRDALQPQSGLYALAQLDQKTRFDVVGSILEVLVAPEDPEAVLARLASSAVRMVTSTVTEKGYCLDARGELDLAHPDIVRDLAQPHRPTSLIGYAVEGLRRRRAAGLPPPAFVSCDNLADNGRLYKAAIVRLAGQKDYNLARWIEAEAAFPRTMVDSITPATDARLQSLVADALGVEDAWPVQRESFVQWVIEDILPKDSSALAAVGVEMTNDVGGYERAKLRLLNGAHSSLAYMGLLRGHETVAQAMANPELAGFVERLMLDDIKPYVAAPEALDVDRYIAAVLARFRNPAIRHTLAQIAWDGSKKLPFRLLGTIGDALAAGRAMDRLARPLAAWMAFVARQAKAGREIVDPLADTLAQMGRAATGNDRDVEAFLALEVVFPTPLAANGSFRDALIEAYRIEAASLCEPLAATRS